LDLRILLMCNKDHILNHRYNVVKSCEIRSFNGYTGGSPGFSVVSVTAVQSAIRISPGA